MSVLARRMARAFYYFNRAKPDMRKKREAVFPNDARLRGIYLFISHSVFPQLSPLR